MPSTSQLRRVTLDVCERMRVSLTCPKSSHVVLSMNELDAAEPVVLELEPHPEEPGCLRTPPSLFETPPPRRTPGLYQRKHADDDFFHSALRRRLAIDRRLFRFPAVTDAPAKHANT